MKFDIALPSITFFRLFKLFLLQVMHVDHSDNIREVKAFDNITMNGDAPATQRTLGYVMHY